MTIRGSSFVTITIIVPTLLVVLLYVFANFDVMPDAVIQYSANKRFNYEIQKMGISPDLFKGPITYTDANNVLVSNCWIPARAGIDKICITLIKNSGEVYVTRINEDSHHVEAIR